MTFARGGIVEIGWPAKVLSPNARAHWATKARATKAYREQAYWLAKAEKIRVPSEGPILVTTTFRPPTRHSRDGDNLLASVKAAIDGIADALGVNDSRFRHQAPVIADPVKGGLVSIHIEVVE